MLDCGSRGRGDRGLDPDAVANFIDSLMGDNTQVTVAVSHPDADHYNYLPSVIEAHRVSAVAVARSTQNYSAEFREWLWDVEKRPGGAIPAALPGPYSSKALEPALSCRNGQGFDVEGRILALNAGTTNNDTSMVVAMQYRSFRALFTGDMTGVTEQEITNKGMTNFAQNVDLLTAAHHGASSMFSNSATWAALTNPQIVVFSAGTQHRHPRCGAVDAYTNAGQNRLLRNVSDHGYRCGNGAYESRPSTRDAVFVTNDNGRFTIVVSPQGVFQYSYEINHLAP